MGLEGQLYVYNGRAGFYREVNGVMEFIARVSSCNLLDGCKLKCGVYQVYQINERRYDEERHGQPVVKRTTLVLAVNSADDKRSNKNVLELEKIE